LLKNKKSILLIMVTIFVFCILASGCGADKKASSSSATDSSATSLSSDADKAGTVKNGTVQMAPPKFDPPKNAGERRSADIKD